MAVGELALTERASGWDLPLAGREVDQICIDFAVTLVVDGSETLRLATRFTLAVKGAALDVDPQVPESILPVLRLRGAVVLTARVGRDGVLHVRFDGDRALRAEPDAAEEAWEVGGGLPPLTSAYRIRALPGGEVAVH